MPNCGSMELNIPQVDELYNLPVIGALVDVSVRDLDLAEAACANNQSTDQQLNCSETLSWHALRREGLLRLRVRALWRSCVGRSTRLQSFGLFTRPSSSPDARSREPVEYISYTCMSKSSQAATMENYAPVINHFYRNAGGVEFETAQSLAIHALKGEFRCHGEFGTLLRMRRPLFWSMLWAREARLVPRYAQRGRRTLLCRARRCVLLSHARVGAFR